jgi:hypothetical protein
MWLQQSCIPAHLVELCCIDVLHAGANLAALPNTQLAVAPEHALQVVIGGCINGHSRRLAPCNNAALPGSLSVVPTGSNQHLWSQQRPSLHMCNALCRHFHGEHVDVYRTANNSSICIVGM